MDLNLTPEEQQFRDEFRAWLEANVPKDWPEHRNEPLQTRFDYMREWQVKLFEGGWAGLNWPKEYGGRGANLMQQVIFWQEMARADAPPIAGDMGLGMIGPTIIHFGSDEQKKQHLQKILRGDTIWSQGFSEPDAGSDLANLKCEARLEGDHYIVNGQKVWTSFGWVADWCELLVRTDKTVAKHKGLSCLLVDMKSPGVEVRPLKMMNGETEFSEMFFTDVKVPVANLIGGAGNGWNVAIGTLMHERASLCAFFQVVYKRMTDQIIAHSRYIMRNGCMASQDPVMRQKLAQCYAEVELMRWSQARNFSQMMATGVPGPDGSIQKLFWSEYNQRLQQVAQELLGPYGQLGENEPYALDQGMWSREYMRSRGHTIEAGTSEIQRNIIGAYVLGLPKSY